MNESEIFKIISILFGKGYLDKEDISRWADMKINMETEIEDFIELSLIKNKKDSEIIALLNTLSGNYSKEIVKIFFFCFYLKVIKNNYNMWLIIEEQLTRDSLIDQIKLNDEESIFISQLLNDLDLRKNNFGGTMDMPNELLFFLEKYESQMNMIYNIDKKLLDTAINKVGV